MGIFNWFKKSEERAIKTNYSGGLKNDDFLRLVLGGGQTDAGVTVNHTTAMQVSAFEACVTVISEDIAALPFFVFHRTTEGKEKAPQHPLYRLLHDWPNPQMTSIEFREAMQRCILVFGNAYAFIEKRNARPVALWPLHPTTVKPFRRNGQLLYNVEGFDQPVTQDLILHIKGKCFDGICGKSMIDTSPNVLGAALAADLFTYKFFANGAHLKGYLESPVEVTDEMTINLKESMKDFYTGVENAHGTPIFEQGMKYVPITTEPEKSQLLQLRKFNVAEIARQMRVPLHKIDEMEKSSFNNIEEMEMDYTRSTLTTWILKWEQEICRKLFMESEKDEYFAEMSLEGRLRGNQDQRYGNYSTAIQNGWMTPKRVAEIENLSTKGLSDEPLSPLNMVPAKERDVAPTDEEQNRFLPVIQDAARRVITKEINAIKRAVKKHGKEELREWANNFYAEHRELVETTFRPAISVACEERAEDVIHTLADDHITSTLAELTKAIEHDTVESFLEKHRHQQDTIATNFAEKKYG